MIKYIGFKNKGFLANKMKKTRAYDIHEAKYIHRLTRSVKHF